MLFEDGQHIIRVIKRGDPYIYLTPKIVADPDKLALLTDRRRQAVTFDNLTIHYVGVTVALMLNGELVGWGGTVQLASEVRAFLDRANVRNPDDD